MLSSSLRVEVLVEPYSHDSTERFERVA